MNEMLDVLVDRKPNICVASADKEKKTAYPPKQMAKIIQ
jgi:hypothetical protein